VSIACNLCTVRVGENAPLWGFRGHEWPELALFHLRLPDRGKQSAMLVLSRKTNQSIVIGENIVVTVVEVRRDKVRLGIEAPKEVPVHRNEIQKRIKSSEAPGPSDRARSDE
jgi:carbon storage regulator